MFLLLTADVSRCSFCKAEVVNRVGLCTDPLWTVVAFRFSVGKGSCKVTDVGVILTDCNHKLS